MTAFRNVRSSLSAALLSRVSDPGWAKREKALRIVTFTANGERRFRNLVAV